MFHLLLNGMEFNTCSPKYIALRILNGVTSPWNTLAIWSVPKLAPTGFLAVAEVKVLLKPPAYSILIGPWY